jgi:hypothetical protein
MNIQAEDHDEQDLAVARRLRRLSTMPVDLSGLEAIIGRDIPRPVSVTRRRLTLRPVLAMAASLVVLVSLAGAVLLSMPRPVVASTEMLSDLYAHNRTAMVDPQPEMTPMPCCVRQVEGRNVTCVAVMVGGKRVMMAVGDGKHFSVPDSAGRKSVNGVEYRYQSAGGVNMVMAVKDGAWVCLMGEASIDELVEQLARTPVKQ